MLRCHLPTPLGVGRRPRFGVGLNPLGARNSWLDGLAFFRMQPGVDMQRPRDFPMRAWQGSPLPHTCAASIRPATLSSDHVRAPRA